MYSILTSECQCNGCISIARLRNHLLMPTKIFEEMEEPKWSRDDLINVMKILTKSNNGWLNYRSLCDEMGNDVVKSLIEYNILHLRPCSTLAVDVIHEHPIVCAELPAVYVAMREVLKEF